VDKGGEKGALQNKERGGHPHLNKKAIAGRSPLWGRKVRTVDLWEEGVW